MVKVIGITGGVGAGKTELLKYIGEHYNCRIIRADEVSHELMQPGGDIYTLLLRLLEVGNPAIDAYNDKTRLLNPDGSINHAEMARRIFSDERLLHQVNELIHPAVRQYIEQSIQEERSGQKHDYLFIEAALLIEEGYNKIVDEMWYIYCRPDVRRRRLQLTRGYSDQKIDRLMEAQLSDREYQEHADHIIDNSTTLDVAYRQIDALLSQDDF